MKKNVAISVVLVAMLLVTGCGKSPKDVAKAFAENLSKGKISEAKNILRSRQANF